MAVKYDVIFKDGKKLSKEAICFGAMAYGNWDNSFNDRDLAARPADQQAMIQFHTGSHIHPIWAEADYTKFRRDWSNGGVSGREKSNANKAFLTELKELVDDLPFVKQVISVHPLVGVVRAHIKNHPSDQIITSLMLVRNLCNYSDMAATYRHFKAAGYRPRFCAVMAHLVSKNFGSMGRSDWSSISIGEYNWINPNHFGKQALINLMGCDESTQFGFHQLPWAEQKGYRRDNWYRDQSRTDWNPQNGGMFIFDDRMIWAEMWDWERNQAVNQRTNEDHGYINYLKTRNIVDWGSISQDEPVCAAQVWNPLHGFTITKGRSSTQTPTDRVNEFVAGCEAVCSEAGISIRL